MIEWHVLDSWTAADARGTALWPIIQTIGGFAAPLFLFLAGGAVPFAIAGHEKRGATRIQASWFVQRRGWEVFLIAHLFRLQSFLTNPHATSSSILKPDILNILGLGLVGTAWLTGRVKRPVYLLLVAAFILFITPWSRVWWWAPLLHPRLEAYIRPVDGYGVFTLFPWLAFVAVGAYVGWLINTLRDPAGEIRLHRQLGLWGLAMAAAGYVLVRIPLPHSVAWSIQAWPLVLIQAGYMTAAIWLTWMWMQMRVAIATAGPMLLFGRTSLFVYWLHVELAFGFLSFPIHYALPLAWSLVGFVLMTIAMYYAAQWWESRTRTPWIPAELRASN